MMHLADRRSKRSEAVSFIHRFGLDVDFGARRSTS